MKKLLIIVLLSQFASCQYKPDNEAIQLLKRANEIGSKSFYKDTIKLNQALKLIDQAINIDDKYFSAYYSKSILLAAKRDIDGSLANNLKMIQLKPDQPLWEIQRGLFFDIKGDSIQAQKNYNSGLKKYNELLTKNIFKQDYNFRIEYISALEAKGNLKLAKEEMEKLKNDFPGNELVSEYSKNYKLKSREELINVWKNRE